MTFFNQKSINTPRYSRIFCDVNSKEFTYINAFLHNIELLDKKIASIEVGSHYSNSLGINQITTKHLDVINDRKITNKETLANFIENIINSSRIILLDQTNLLVSRATIQYIHKNSLVIVVPMNHCKLPNINIEYNHLMLDKVDVKTFFQILSNNYHHNSSKLAFLNFFARYANHSGLFTMGQRQLLSSVRQNEININISHQKNFIFMNNNSNSLVEIFESFKINQISQDNKIYPISAIVGLCSTIDVTDKPKIMNQKLFIYAEDAVIDYLSGIVPGNWFSCFKNYNANASNASDYIDGYWENLLYESYADHLNSYYKHTNNHSYTIKEHRNTNLRASCRISIF